MSKLPQEKYIGDTVSIARDLLGRYLVRMWQGQPLVCRIVETEAYVGAVDKAAHAYGYHRTQRNAVMFGPPGHAYIYLIYGMHCCLNFVTEPEGEPSAVLLRGSGAGVGHRADEPPAVRKAFGAAEHLPAEEFSQRAGQMLPGFGT